LALSANDPAYQPGFESADTRVQGCVPFYGIYDFTDQFGLHRNRALLDALESYIFKTPLRAAPELFRQASPLHRVHADAPPFLILHGLSDSVCSAQEAEKFAELLSACSRQPVIYADIAGAQHAFDVFRSLRSELVMFGVERFLAWLYSRHLDLTRPQ
jgi:dipeptidyl aminopeptidase/acylaminoacyl peptidase